MGYLGGGQEGGNEGRLEDKQSALHGAACKQHALSEP